MKAFVTGSTGLLGSNLVRQLAAEKYEVVALARSAEKATKFLGDTNAQIAIGDMLNLDAFTPQLAGCDVLFHTAAYFKEYTGADADGEKMLQAINVDGTIALFNAAQKHGVKNIVYVSSGGVIAAAKGKTANERSPYNEQTANRYFQSKIRAEKAIATWLTQNPDMRVVQILPGAILGPGDNGPTGLGRTVISVLEGSLPAIPPGGFTLVDVRDVVDAMVQAVDKGQSGDRFIIVGRHYALAELIPMIAEAGGVKAPTFKLPYPVAWVYGAASEAVAAVTGNPPLATRVMIKTLTDGGSLSSELAEQTLGVTFRPITQTIQDSVQWFREFEYA